MSPQQELLELLLYPLQSADDTKEPFRNAKSKIHPANQPLFADLMGDGFGPLCYFLLENILTDI
jgi:hypothetical protein